MNIEVLPSKETGILAQIDDEADRRTVELWIARYPRKTVASVLDALSDGGNQSAIARRFGVARSLAFKVVARLAMSGRIVPKSILDDPAIRLNPSGFFVDRRVDNRGTPGSGTPRRP